MNTTDSPAVLQLRVDLWNIRYFIDHTEPGYHRDEIDEAVRKVFKRWDRVNEEAMAR